ncbi:uncharacterized protein At4g17910-like isoform X2 [Camellia sinensis]|uniref:uncharacterized protein At4g17910-like isoform X2 n=1 Tax=Camellia sinensis TaxID=4442 RepID=UPI001036EB89|nr:uncharacterized protein At4g17910-like isoform X2 [Camellia sinensis]
MSGAAEVFYASETGKWGCGKSFTQNVQCNAAYVTFVLAQNLQVLAILMPSDYIPGHKITVLEQAFNRNLLGSFLRIGNGGK